jgi:hypothetical protein
LLAPQNTFAGVSFSVESSVNLTLIGASRIEAS